MTDGDLRHPTVNFHVLGEWSAPSDGFDIQRCDDCYRITPSNGIVDSLAVLEQVEFEHFVPEPPQPGEDSLQRVFDAIEPCDDD